VNISPEKHLGERDGLALQRLWDLTVKIDEKSFKIKGRREKRLNSAPG